MVLAYLWTVSRGSCSNQPGQPHTNEDFNGIALSWICHHALQQQENKWICLAVAVHSKLGSVDTELNSLKVCLLRHRQHLLLQLCFFFLYSERHHSVKLWTACNEKVCCFFLCAPFFCMLICFYCKLTDAKQIDFYRDNMA